MDDSEHLAFLKQLYVTASQVEGLVAQWLIDVCEGRRCVQVADELDRMRELLERATHQKGELAAGIFAALARDARA